jgi:predicted  nucleic acid-binding Zn-ribbon protein
MSRPFKLYRLQQIDSQLDWIHTRLLEIEAALQDDATLQQASEATRQSENAHQAALKALHHSEDNVRQQRLKIEQNEASLYGGKIRNPKELKDLENEVASLKRYLSVLEDRQLEAMLAEEDAMGSLKLVRETMEQAHAGFEHRCSDLIREKEKILKDQERLDGERQAAIGSILPEDMAQYVQLRKTRRGVAVAMVVERACSACGSTLNATLLNAVHSPNQITVCDACGRILYKG